jgi:hypothetical protein
MFGGLHALNVRGSTSKLDQRSSHLGQWGSCLDSREHADFAVMNPIFNMLI